MSLPSLFPTEIVDSILFPCPKSTYQLGDFPDEVVWIPRSLAAKDAGFQDSVPCLLLTSPSARFFVLYLHSNAEDLGRCRSFCDIIRQQFQVHVLAVEYPGYGLCSGKATEETVIEHAELALRFLRETLAWSLDEILVMGRSIGCGPAVHLASRHKVGGLILICPFASVRELFREFVGLAAAVMRERFPNLELMPTVSSPLLLVHGRQDSIVPWQHGESLYKACRTRKRMVLPEMMHHNSNLLVDPTVFVLPMLQFFTLPDYTFEELKVPEWCRSKFLAALTPRSCRSAVSGTMLGLQATFQHPSSPLEPRPAPEETQTPQEDDVGGPDSRWRRGPSEQPHEPRSPAEASIWMDVSRAASPARGAPSSEATLCAGRRASDRPAEEYGCQLEVPGGTEEGAGPPAAAPAARSDVGARPGYPSERGQCEQPGGTARGLAVAAPPRMPFGACSSSSSRSSGSSPPSALSPPPSPPPGERQELRPAQTQRCQPEMPRLDLSLALGLPVSRRSVGDTAVSVVEGRFLRYLQIQMQSPRSECTSDLASEEEIEFEEGLVQTAIKKCPSWLEEDVAMPPEDVGFYKVPTTRRGGPGNATGRPRSSCPGPQRAQQLGCTGFLGCGALLARVEDDASLRSTFVHESSKCRPSAGDLEKGPPRDSAHGHSTENSQDLPKEREHDASKFVFQVSSLGAGGGGLRQKTLMRI